MVRARARAGRRVLRVERVRQVVVHRVQGFLVREARVRQLRVALDEVAEDERDVVLRLVAQQRFARLIADIFKVRFQPFQPLGIARHAGPVQPEFLLVKAHWILPVAEEQRVLDQTDPVRALVEAGMVVEQLVGEYQKRFGHCGA